MKGILNFQAILVYLLGTIILLGMFLYFSSFHIGQYVTVNRQIMFHQSMFACIIEFEEFRSRSVHNFLSFFAPSSASTSILIQYDFYQCCS